jgi:hypothetical protein
LTATVISIIKPFGSSFINQVILIKEELAVMKFLMSDEGG